ncbi:NAD(P)H-dependent oxidoreductase [Sphingobium sp. HBC34]|uniref:NAD(P)H-dependent oxidoreductase n=1 Tax=Sphingobium cyanobacteriorum TaxID=3063954 RepID=A0ABT8ZH39_9SPHN|nr:NAD(P)H-dependent oxidoreductase [Sphingobium sp. HBC34]MDO7833453.1 NAD(P)H-dependent oxidoreductase [Sphingobium sp. HBC34]
MNVLIVSAHPGPASLTNALRDVAVEQLRADGHEVRISDLYAMNWKAAHDCDDFTALSPDEPLSFPFASMRAADTRAFSDDIIAEQDKALWADALILAFPLWWFSMPAILKGWIDRVWTAGVGYQISGNRYGAGRMAGKRAMLMVMVGGGESYFSDRGVNGPIDDLLFPINHGCLYYPGYDVLPSYVLHKTDRLDEEGFKAAAQDVRDRMRTLFTTAPIPYRPQAEDYTERKFELKEDIAATAPPGFAGHIRQQP